MRYINLRFTYFIFTYVSPLNYFLLVLCASLHQILATPLFAGGGIQWWIPPLMDVDVVG